MLLSGWFVVCTKNLTPKKGRPFILRIADQSARTQLHGSGALDERTGPYASNENHAAFDGQKTEANLVFTMNRTLIFPGHILRMVPR